MTSWLKNGLNQIQLQQNNIKKPKLPSPDGDGSFKVKRKTKAKNNKQMNILAFFVIQVYHGFIT